MSEKRKTWKEKALEEGKVFLIWLVGLFVLSIFFKDVGPLFKFFPSDSWEIRQIEVYGGDVFRAGIGVLIVFYFWKFYQMFLQWKKEIFEEYNITPEQGRLIEIILPLLLIVLSWYILAGVQGAKQINYISQESFPFFGAFTLVLGSFLKVEIKSIFFLFSVVAGILAVVSLYTTMEKK